MQRRLPGRRAVVVAGVVVAQRDVGGDDKVAGAHRRARPPRDQAAEAFFDRGETSHELGRGDVGVIELRRGETILIGDVEHDQRRRRHLRPKRIGQRRAANAAAFVFNPNTARARMVAQRHAKLIFELFDGWLRLIGKAAKR